VCSCQHGQSVYSKLEHHAVRIFLLILAVIAMYKVIRVETHEVESPPSIIMPCTQRPQANYSRGKRTKPARTNRPVGGKSFGTLVSQNDDWFAEKAGAQDHK